VLTFPQNPNASTPQQEAIIGYQDRYGNALIFTRDSNSNLIKIASPNGRYIQFTLDLSGLITQATDNTGRIVHYSYDSGGRLTTVVDANGGTTSYLRTGQLSLTPPAISSPSPTLCFTSQPWTGTPPAA
jgi:YD repeat-containing protein